jgi:putative acetyltransferase
VYGRVSSSAFLREDYLNQVQGFDLSRASELMRSTPSKSVFRRCLIVQLSSMPSGICLKVMRMPPAVCLESITCADHPLMPALRGLLLDYQRWLGIDLCFQDFEREMAQLPGDYTAPDGRLYVATVNTMVAGCVALRRHDATSGEMKRLYLRPAFQGQRLGRLMAQHIVADARQVGYQRLLLDTLPMMHAAQGLYASLGFKDTAAYVHNPVSGVRYLALSLSATS